PSSVRPERSLLTRRAESATANSSGKRMPGSLAPGGLRLGGFLLLLGHRVDAIAVLDLAQRLERPRDDLLARPGPREQLDHQLSGDAGFDRDEERLALAKGVDA